MTILLDKERKVFSQNGEDGILEFIFDAVSPINSFFVELGVGDGTECNTRYLKESFSWQGVWIDCLSSPSSDIFSVKITKENILDILSKLSVPRSFDLLSIDLDSNDYWIASEILTFYRPNVIVVEYNASYPPPQSCAVEYSPDLSWRGTDYFGASLCAWYKLMSHWNYSLIGCESRGVNAFFVRSVILPSTIPALMPTEAYRPPGYGRLVEGAFAGHTPDAKRLIEV